MGITKTMALLLMATLFTVAIGAPLGLSSQLLMISDTVLLLLYAVDVLISPRRRHFAAVRSFSDSFELRRETLVTATVENKSRQRVSMRIIDTPPATFLWEHTPQAEHCPPGGRLEIRYAARPTQRGRFSFGDCHVEIRGRLGLCTRRFALPCPDSVPVYPDLGPMRKYRMLASRRQLARADASVHRVRGVGTEFTGIREYTPDDDIRKINWMATARAGRPMTNVYDVERGQQIILAIDTGRWMEAPMGDVTRLDRAAETAAALAQVALSSGDRVGLVLYGAEVTTFLPPDKGARHMARLLELLYKVSAARVESSLTDLAAFLETRVRRRAFVCLFSYLDGAEAAHAAGAALARTARRHAVLCASLSNPELSAMAAQPSDDMPALYHKAAAIYRSESEQEAVPTLRRAGIHCHAADPARLLSYLVRQYMTHKNRT
ncbi:MAG: DUF58 domain-containing protein [Oscillospiraceae bacterium]|jgi:uncharacterized protein (DUF58 family)|nr:DUF58 domain-containing protein [Oscillospiraceae bacterium]